MSYATEAELDIQFGTRIVTKAADRDGDGTRDTGVIAGALSDSSEEMDSYIGVRYELPLTATPSVLVRLCGDITMYRMCSDAGTLTNEKRVRYEDAIAWLDKIASGKATLGESDEDEESNADVTVSDITQARLFTRTTLAGLF